MTQAHGAALSAGGQMSMVHWSAFDDAAWACGGKWPEPLSRRPLIYGPGYPRVTTNAREVNCPGCMVFCSRVTGDRERGEGK